MTERPDPNLVLGEADGGRLAQNITYFGRLLRAAGLPVGPGKVLDAVEAVAAAGVSSRADFYWTLHAVFVNRRDQRDLFDQAFHFFWRNPNLLERMMGMLLPSFRGDEETGPEREEMSRRLAEALAAERGGEDSDAAEEEEIEFDATLTFSREEVLQDKDFEKMSADELAEARAAIRRLTLTMKPFPTRRFHLHPRGRRIDMRATLRAAARKGGDLMLLKHRKRRREPPPIVVLCDISGSMDRYSRMLLHFLHALTNDRHRVHSFLFGTRLTNVTRYMKDRDPDVAVDRIADAVDDWAGGTRIGHALHVFNRDWSRRVLSRGAIVLLITDGLDREGAAGLEEEVERLHKSCRRLIWLNPLLRYERYEPKAAGARAMMRHVDEFRTVHNLAGLTDLAAALAEETAARPSDMMEWRRLAA